jgi:hypothetical protein
MAPSSISAGDGPSSPPPASAGASSTTRCGPIVASAFIPLIHCTLTVLAMSPSSLDASAGDRLDNEASSDTDDLERTIQMRRAMIHTPH